MKTTQEGAGKRVTPANVRSAVVTARLLAARKVTRPRIHVGSRLRFADGGVSVVPGDGAP